MSFAVATMNTGFGRLHHFRQLGLGDGAIVIDGFVGQAAGVGGRKTGQVADQQVQRLVGGLHFAMAVLRAPIRGDVIDDAAQFVGGGQRQPEIRGKGAQLLRHWQRRANQNHGGIELGIRQRDVLEKTDVNVVLQVGMKVQQHEQAGRGRGLDVIEDFLGFQHRRLRLVAGIEGLQPFSDRPAEGPELELPADLPHQRNDLRLLIALDRDERRPRADDGRQIAERAFGGHRAGLPQFRRWNIHCLCICTSF